jgi:hypothetical protein
VHGVVIRPGAGCQLPVVDDRLAEACTFYTSKNNCKELHRIAVRMGEILDVGHHSKRRGYESRDLKGLICRKRLLRLCDHQIVSWGDAPPTLEHGFGCPYQMVTRDFVWAVPSPPS